MQKSSSFHVYNASAGSGKTFTLVKEYLKILLTSSDVFRFQKVLAVTFTNKAAGEMKERVMKNLHDFSEGKQNDLLQLILQETALSTDVLQERSTKILNAILKNYSAFSITTIDSFTHKIIKNFAYDLGLTLNFEVEMDAVSLLHEAVDLLISKIGTNKELTRLLIDFSLSKIDEDRSWDISNELKEFSKLLLNEDDVKHFKTLSKKSIQDFNQLQQNIKKHQEDVTTRLKAIGKTGLEVIANTNLAPNDFYRSMLPNHFVALEKDLSKAKFFDGSKLKERIEEQNFYAKSKPDAIKEAIESVLPKLLVLYAESETLYQQFLVNQLALKSIIPLAVLNNINSELTFLKEENNIQLNAEFNQLIAEHIKDQPTPFIYERIGQRFMHYFIDEMQDTSVMQWENLIPLIDNALSQENSSLLLVGDGKQAIYRWRGGKAEQFVNLGLEDASHPFQTAKEIKALERNYRSYSDIIKFNNQFFQHVAGFFQNENYQHLFVNGNKQLENSKQGGLVTLSFLEKADDKDEEQLKYPKQVLNTIKELQHEFSLHEICVLVRKKKDGIAVANYLSEHGVPIVSSETLLLQNSSKVNFIIDVLRIIYFATDEETRFEVLYFLYLHLQVSEEKHQFLNRFIKKDNTTFFLELKDYGVEFKLESFHQLPFYEKVEHIISCFNLVVSSDAYVQFFLDEVLNQQRKGVDIQDFLNYWSNKKSSLSIIAPESANAVSIMTIHKSKGLEFPVVIFPYDLDVYRQVKPKVWLNDLPKTFEGFNELLVDYGKSLKYIGGTSSELYQTQREELELDNFNLLYVVLTRAVEQLHIITEKRVTKSVENVNYYSGIFINFLKSQQLWNDEQNYYVFGESKRQSVPESLVSNLVVQESFISTPWKEHNIVMLASSSKLWGTKQEGAIDYGNMVHELMSKIYTYKDVDSVLELSEKQGDITKLESLEINAITNKIVKHPELSMFFSEGLTVYNEREIVTIDGQIVIPDRLVFEGNNVTIIDYKTGKQDVKYKQQLESYKLVLKFMGYSTSKMLLVYIRDVVFVEEV